MKKIIPFCLFVLLVSSCDKSKCNKTEDLTYYSPDYKEKQMSVLNTPTSSIDAFWIEFYQNDGSKDYTRYTLNIKTNGVVISENGSCQINWGNQISFMPDSGNSYDGTFTYEKEKFTIAYHVDTRTENLTFVYKETKKKKKWFK